MSDAGSAEREGEEEVQLGPPPQVQVQAQAEVKADENLGVLGIVPQISEEDPWWEKGVPEEEEKKEGEEEEKTPEEEEEGSPEETEEERAERKARRRYLKDVAAFYLERDAFFKMQRNKTVVGKAAFWKSFKEGKNDSRLATIGKDGTMTLFDKENNKPIHVIKPLSYHEPEPEDHEKVDTWRLKHIKSAETLFESAKQTLREAVAAGRHVKSAQRMALEADQALQQARFATKGTQYYKSVVMNQLLFDNKYDTHRTEVVAFVSTPMTSQQRYAVQDIPGEEEEEASAESVETDFILFEKPVGDHDFLSSWYMQKFKYKGIKYRCAFQAIMAELARKFGDDELAETVMEAREPEDMVVTWDELDGATDRDWKQKLKKLILKVNRAKFEDETLADQLVATGDKHLGCIPPEDDTDDYQGIGRSFDDPKARRRDKWKKGGNQYGKILEQIRTEIVMKRNPGAKRTARRSTKVEETKEEEEDNEGEAREKDAGEEEEEEEEEVKPKTKGPSKEVRAVYIEEYTQALADGDKAGAARIAAQAKKAGVELPSAKVSKSVAKEAPVKPSKSVAKEEPVKPSKSAKKQTTVELEEE